MLNLVDYRLDLPVELEHIHNAFHIPQLRKDIPDPNPVIIAEPIEVAENLVYKERPVQILDYIIKQPQNKSIPCIKVLWANHTSSKSTWETEEDMKSKYPYLFELQLRLVFKPVSFEDETYFKGEGCNDPNLNHANYFALY